MTLDQVRYFLAAANYQHVGKAARSVFISPSVISSAIATLEEELDCKLFERKSKRIFLTPMGLDVQRWAERFLGEADSLKTNLKKQLTVLRGTYRLAASHFLSSRILAKGWFALQEKHPQLVGDLKSMDTAILLSEVLSGKVDLGLCFSPLKHPELEEVILHKGSLLLAARKGHPIFKKRPEQRLKELQAYPAVLHKAAQGVDICERHPMFERFNLQPAITLSFDSDDVAIAKLKTSNSWSLLPDIVIDSCKDLQIVVWPPNWEASYHISTVRHRNKTLDRALEELIAKLRKQLLEPFA